MWVGGEVGVHRIKVHSMKFSKNRKKRGVGEGIKFGLDTEHSGRMLAYLA